MRSARAGFIVAIAVPLLAACTSPAEKQARADKVAVTAISAESSKAAAAAAIPSTGKWDEPHLVERLVRAGLAPQAMAGETGEKYWTVPVRAYRVGQAVLYAYIYRDSLARRTVTAALDTATAAPRGVSGTYPMRHVLIIQNNLAAVLVGGSDTQQERVSLALEAGLPVTYK